jgi:hypothetical protein
MERKRLTHDCFVADFYINKKVQPPTYHYIITKIGSSEIISWGQKASWREAESEAMRCMKEQAKRRAA